MLNIEGNFVCLFCFLGMVFEKNGIFLGIPWNFVKRSQPSRGIAIPRWKLRFAGKSGGGEDGGEGRCRWVLWEGDDTFEQWSFHPGWLGYRGSSTTQLYIGSSKKPIYVKDPYEPTNIVECHKGFDHGSFLIIAKWFHSCKLTVRPCKMLLGWQTFPFEIVTFQVALVNFPVN